MVDGTKEIFKDFLGNLLETTELQMHSGETVTLQNMQKRTGHGKIRGKNNIGGCVQGKNSGCSIETIQISGMREF